MSGRAEIVCVFGRRGTGKTTLAKTLASAWPTDLVRVHDPMAEFDEYDTIEADMPVVPGSLYVLDEIDLICGPRYYEHEWLHNVVHYGRHYSISIIVCSRRPSNIHRDITALTTTVYMGRITEPRDIKYCVDSWGSACEKLHVLPNFKFIKIEP